LFLKSVASTGILSKSVSHRVLARVEESMATVTKKELIDRIADSAGHRRVQVKRVIQQFLDEIVAELGKGNRLEFRDFGVFETKLRKARKAQNPKTLMPVAVPEKRTVKFKVGRLMKQRLAELTGNAFDDDGGDGEADDEESAAPSESPGTNHPQSGA
jgi:integration host factor subunit beta